MLLGEQREVVLLVAAGEQPERPLGGAGAQGFSLIVDAREEADGDGRAGRGVTVEHAARVELPVAGPDDLVPEEGDAVFEEGRARVEPEAVRSASLAEPHELERPLAGVPSQDGREPVSARVGAVAREAERGVAAVGAHDLLAAGAAGEDEGRGVALRAPAEIEVRARHNRWLANDSGHRAATRPARRRGHLAEPLPEEEPERGFGDPIGADGIEREVRRSDRRDTLEVVLGQRRGRRGRKERARREIVARLLGGLLEDAVDQRRQLVRDARVVLQRARELLGQRRHAIAFERRLTRAGGGQGRRERGAGRGPRRGFTRACAELAQLDPPHARAGSFFAERRVSDEARGQRSPRRGLLRRRPGDGSRRPEEEDDARRAADAGEDHEG